MCRLARQSFLGACTCFSAAITSCCCACIYMSEASKCLCGVCWQLVRQEVEEDPSSDTIAVESQEISQMVQCRMENLNLPMSDYGQCL